jgi:hypothetical protein
MTARRSLWLAALCLSAAAAARAQTSGEPNLVFSIGLGLTTGRSLWTVPIQPLPVVGTSSFDTVALGRRLRPGITGTLGITLFRSPNLGYTLEIGYFGVESEARCDGPDVWKPTGSVPELELNRQACESAMGTHIATGAVGFLLGVTYRWRPAARVSPYARAGLGPALLGTASFVTTEGMVSEDGINLQRYVLLEERDAPEVTWMASVSGGLAYFLGPGYRVRMEVRDLITALSVATGPAGWTANPGLAPTGSRVVHVPTITFGLDVVLERRHTRRY